MDGAEALVISAAAAPADVMTARVMRMIRNAVPAGTQLSLSQGETEAMVTDRYRVELNRLGHDMDLGDCCRFCHGGFRRYPGAAIFIYSDFEPDEQCDKVQMHAYPER